MGTLRFCDSVIIFCGDDLTKSCFFKITILSHSQSFEGAQSSAIIKTLFGIGKRNGLDSKKYINHLLTYLPNEDTLEENEIL